MKEVEADKKKRVINPVFIVSGSTGDSAEQIVSATLAQFPCLEVPILKFAQVHDVSSVEPIVLEAHNERAITIVHTLVDRNLRTQLQKSCHEHEVSNIDLTGPFIDSVARVSNKRPLEIPGLYRDFHAPYWDRMEAINFAVRHDDGQRIEDLQEHAEIVLCGPSRLSKTPISMYLAVHGWRCANCPFIPNMDVPKEIGECKSKVFVLVMDSDRLVKLRENRAHDMHLTNSYYTNPNSVFNEIEFARTSARIFQFCLLDITHTPVEQVASRIVATMRERHPENVRFQMRRLSF